MAASAAVAIKRKSRKASVRLSGVQDSLEIAKERGLLEGGRTQMIRGRMPASLVAEAKRNSGIKSDSKLIEAALAKMAVADDYGAWLVSQRGTIKTDLNLDDYLL